jgi:hypothetical protein
MNLEIKDLINFWGLDLKSQVGNTLKISETKWFVESVLIAYQDKLRQKIKEIPNDADLGNWIREEINKQYESKSSK